MSTFSDYTDPRELSQYEYPTYEAPPPYIQPLPCRCYQCLFQDTGYRLDLLEQTPAYTEAWLAELNQKIDSVMARQLQLEQTPAHMEERFNELNQKIDDITARQAQSAPTALAGLTTMQTEMRSLEERLTSAKQSHTRKIEKTQKAFAKQFDAIEKKATLKNEHIERATDKRLTAMTRQMTALVGRVASLESTTKQQAALLKAVHTEYSANLAQLRSLVEELIAAQKPVVVQAQQKDKKEPKQKIAQPTPKLTDEDLLEQFAKTTQHTPKPARKAPIPQSDHRKNFEDALLNPDSHFHLIEYSATTQRPTDKNPQETRCELRRYALNPSGQSPHLRLHEEKKYLVLMNTQTGTCEPLQWK